MPTPNSLTELISNVDAGDWLPNGACVDLPVDAIDRFFVEAGARIEREYEELCARCTVRPECLAHALRAGVPAGYFGGMSPTQRRRLGVS